MAMDRNTYIGSSDARDILSGDWDKLYRVKTGAVERDDLSGVFPVQLGLLTEDFHLDWTVDALMKERGEGYKWSKLAADGEQHSATFTPEASLSRAPLASHPDALLRIPDGTIVPIEVKITGRFKNADEASDFYMPQLQHHMICWGVDLLLFSVVVGTTEPERIWIGRSQEWQDHYLERCDRFWSHIANRQPPAPSFYGNTKAPKLVPTKVADSVPRNGFKRRSLDGSNEAAVLIPQFIETKAAVKRHEQIKDDLKAMMADDENELYGDALTMKRDSRGAIRFTIHEAKAA